MHRRHPLYDKALASARNIIRYNADLGFDTTGEALGAVVRHADWQHRWEVEGPDAVAVLESFRAAHLHFFPHWQNAVVTLRDGSKAHGASYA